MKRIQDSVHGLIEFAGRESLAVEMLRTPEVQRLRRVRQLGLAHLVFPAAEHSRFAHAIGVAHLSSRFANALKLATRDFLSPELQVDEMVARDLVLAGLCHDIGHGPLSHAWERYVIRRLDFAEWARALELPDRPWIKDNLEWHELLTQACLLSEESKLNQYLEQVERGLSDRVAALLAGRYYLRYVRRLFASDVDVDRGDFILRDAIQTGVAYGRYDLDWLVSTITVGTYREDEPTIGFDINKGARVVEQFLVARRALYDTVYFHKAVRSAEGMVGRLLSLAQERSREGRLDVIPGFETLQKAISGESMSLPDVLELDDNLLWVFIDRLAKDASDPALKNLASRLRVRQLLRPVQVSAKELELFLSDPYRASEVAETVLRKCGIEEPRRYLLYSRVPFAFFEDEEHSTMFIDASDSARPATPIRNHSDLFHGPTLEHVARNLFVPREAVAELSKAIKKEVVGGALPSDSLEEALEIQFDRIVERPDGVSAEEALTELQASN